MRSGCVGSQPIRSRVSVLEARRSSATKLPSHPEVLGCLLWSNRAKGEVELPADRRGDVAQRHALLSHPVQHGSGRGVFQREAEQTRGVEAVDRGPVVAPVADVPRDALVARDADERRNEAGVAVAVDARREANARRAHAGRRELERGPLGPCALARG